MEGIYLLESIDCEVGLTFFDFVEFKAQRNQFSLAF